MSEYRFEFAADAVGVERKRDTDGFERIGGVLIHPSEHSAVFLAVFSGRSFSDYDAYAGIGLSPAAARHAAKLLLKIADQAEADGQSSTEDSSA